MTTNRPAWASEYGPSYEDIVRSWGYRILDFETFGSYQGDHLALLEGQGVGIVVFGYGSCSGCDHLQAITPYEWDDENTDWTPVIEFASELRGGIHWEPTRDALRAWIDEHPENYWWAYDEEVARWLNANLGTSLKVEEDW